MTKMLRKLLADGVVFLVGMGEQPIVQSEREGGSGVGSVEGGARSNKTFALT